MDEMGIRGQQIKYESLKGLLENEISPLLDIISRTSMSISSITNSARCISDINVTETHQIKELLEQAFKLRKINEKMIELVEERSELFFKAVKNASEE